MPKWAFADLETTGAMSPISTFTKPSAFLTVAVAQGWALLA
jgi:hypothetical protein